MTTQPGNSDSDWTGVEPNPGPDPDDPRMIAGIKLLERTGVRSFQLRYSDDEDPVVWMAVGEWSMGANGRPIANGGITVHEAAASINPVQAVLRLCDQVMDGGHCNHCHRTTGVTDHWTSDMPLADVVCWYVYDPETETFRRSCEAER
jgi:hypothetical protein